MSFANPMGYWCNPNGCTPDYAAEHDFRSFIAYGMCLCYSNLRGSGTENLNATDDDVFWLRKNFLNEVENALDVLPDMKEDSQGQSKSNWFQGDHDQSGPTITCKDGSELSFAWMFIRYDPIGKDSILVFDLTWGGPEPDDRTIWLRADAVDDSAAAVLAEARALNEKGWKHEEVDS